jgi:SP family general alpha glucoside:H+ symporter-like MFS transporter
VRRNRPITIPVTLTSPSLDVFDERGLQYLASVFRPLNETFFAVWNGATQDCNREWLLRLEDDVHNALPSILDVSDDETANIRVSQYWLLIKLWELFPRWGFLSSDSAYECLTFRYPVGIANKLTNTMTILPVSSLQVHGIGMVQ